MVQVPVTSASPGKTKQCHSVRHHYTRSEAWMNVCSGRANDAPRTSSGRSNMRQSTRLLLRQLWIIGCRTVRKPLGGCGSNRYAMIISISHPSLLFRHQTAPTSLDWRSKVVFNPLLTTLYQSRESVSIFCTCSEEEQRASHIEFERTPIAEIRAKLVNIKRKALETSPKGFIVSTLFDKFSLNNDFDKMPDETTSDFIVRRIRSFRSGIIYNQDKMIFE